MSETAGRALTLHLTPMVRQYLEIKAQHPDAVLLYRMGDFFEMFFDDALKAAPILEVQLTARNRGSESEAPMCGIPHHALDAYLGQAAGGRPQGGDLRPGGGSGQGQGAGPPRGRARGHPGDALRSRPARQQGRQPARRHRLERRRSEPGEPREAGAGAGAFLDVSTGDFFVRRWATAEEAADDLALLRPRELLLAAGGELPPRLREWAERDCPCVTPLAGDRLLDPRRAAELLQRHLGAGTLRGFGLQPDEPAVLAAASALAYARETQRSELAHVQALTVREVHDRLILDAATLANLEVFRPAAAAAAAAPAGPGRRRATLLGVLDRTATPPGARTLREWLRRPLRDPQAIARRHEAVAELAADHPRRERLRDRLARAGDPERLLARAVLGTLSPREAAALRDGLAEAPAILAELAASEAPLLAELAAADPLPGLAAELARVLEAVPAATLDEGGVIAAGVDPELDRYRSLTRDSKRHVLALEDRERERTGIGSLKVRYNRVFGYYIEVTRSNLAGPRRLPPQADARQRRALRHAGAQGVRGEGPRRGRAPWREHEIFRRLAATSPARRRAHAQAAARLATLDVLAALAEDAALNNYMQPRMCDGRRGLTIGDGRHPVVEQAGRGDASSPTTSRSTRHLAARAHDRTEHGRQVHLHAPGGADLLLAQVGSLRPRATTRAIGARRSHLHARRRVGQPGARRVDVHGRDDARPPTSCTTPRRAAWSCSTRSAGARHLRRPVARLGGRRAPARRHRAPEDALRHPLPRADRAGGRGCRGVVNFHVAVREWKDDIVFLHRSCPGERTQSTASRWRGSPACRRRSSSGPPRSCANLEAQEYDLSGRPRLARGSAPAAAAAADPAQLTLFAPPEQVVAALLRDLDLDQLAPLAALNLLHTLKSRLS